MNAPDEPPQGLNRTLQENIDTFAHRRRESAERAGLSERISSSVTRFAGSITFVIIHAVVFGGWIAVNSGLVPGVPVFDQSLVKLATFASVEAIFLSTFVLIAQNQMAAVADRRADLDLHIGLLAEAELTRLAELTLRIAQAVGVSVQEPEIHEVTELVDPGKVLDELERRESE